jgi:hypothetical protein
LFGKNKILFGQSPAAPKTQSTIPRVRFWGGCVGLSAISFFKFCHPERSRVTKFKKRITPSIPIAKIGTQINYRFDLKN